MLFVLVVVVEAVAVRQRLRVLQGMEVEAVAVAHWQQKCLTPLICLQPNQ
jgi:hypothetical protein